jgi:NADPH2:quinone reductase
MFTKLNARRRTGHAVGHHAGMRAIQVSEFGGPEMMRVVELPDPVAGPGQVLIDVERAGINNADTHQVENTYLSTPELPFVPGGEVAGRTADGRRVVAFTTGGYAEKAVSWEPVTFEVPDGVELGQALALLVQGTTAWHLLRTCTHMQPGESVVVHAAAGGVGTLSVQLAKMWGAGRVIATASSEQKRKLALDLGADVAVGYDHPDGLAAGLVEANGGKNVDIVLEMVGGHVFKQSLRALAPFGRLAFFGAAGREPAEPVDPRSLMRHGTAIIGFWLMLCFQRPQMLAEPMAELFELVRTGALKPIVGATYALGDAPQAHRDLRSRGTVGKLLLDTTR